jgi:hypothetical protein
LAIVNLKEWLGGILIDRLIDGRHPVHMEQVGWSRLLASTDLMTYKHTYWKMTNLNQSWRKGSRYPSLYHHLTSLMVFFNLLKN